MVSKAPDKVVYVIPARRGSHFAKKAGYGALGCYVVCVLRKGSDFPDVVFASLNHDAAEAHAKDLGLPFRKEAA